MVADEDKKPAAASPSSASSPSKRRKTMEEIYDVADQLGFRSGDRFEVKWTIRDEDDEGAAVVITMYRLPVMTSMTPGELLCGGPPH